MKSLIPLIIILSLVSCDNDPEPTALEGTWTFTSTGSGSTLNSSFKISKKSTYQLNSIVVNQQSWNSFELHDVTNNGFGVISIRIAKNEAPAIAFNGCRLSENKKELHIDSLVYYPVLNPTSAVWYYDQVLKKN